MPNDLALLLIWLCKDLPCIIFPPLFLCLIFYTCQWNTTCFGSEKKIYCNHFELLLPSGQVNTLRILHDVHGEFNSNFVSWSCDERIPRIYICNPDNCIALGTFLTLQRKLSLRALPYLSRSLDLGKNRQQKVCWVKK